MFYVWRINLWETLTGKIEKCQFPTFRLSTQLVNIAEEWTNSFLLFQLSLIYKNSLVFRGKTGDMDNSRRASRRFS